MSNANRITVIRAALANLPESTSHGEVPSLPEVYLPWSHLKALDPDNLLVTGMRGAGKTFWWGALQDPAVRNMVGQTTVRPLLDGGTTVRIGFGVRPSPNDYPGKDVLALLDGAGYDHRTIWKTVLARHLAPDGHTLLEHRDWEQLVDYVSNDPESVDRLFYERDLEFDRRGDYFLVLFDALDRCADDWRKMHQFIRGLLQIALEMRSYKKIRLKVFLRSDQVSETEVADFPDASKLFASSVQLDWPRWELYGLMWHCLVNRPGGDDVRTAVNEIQSPSRDAAGQSVFSFAPITGDEARYRERFHTISGPWMGRGPKRGFPYTWIPNHLADTHGLVSPRSFLSALRNAAKNTAAVHPTHEFALHYDSIKRGVQTASSTRVSELEEDYPWIKQVLTPLRGLVVPCEFSEIVARWETERVQEKLLQGVVDDDVKLPPRHVREGVDGLLNDLETLGVFQRIRDGRVNIPDVFRVGYGLGRRGGVRPVLTNL